MKVVQNGTSYRIYDEGMITHDKLPVQAYLVCFDKMMGPFLKKYNDINVSEKVYGVHEEKVNKVLNSFSAFNRNLGVILSGDKGIGKSLFSKLLSKKAIEAGYPLLVVNSWFPGIAEYLNEIEQEVIVLFDEFDKTFATEGDNGPQTEMLTLFDGIAQGKKLFCVTCNDLSRLNSYLVNRPGRFHYHFRFEYPTPVEIREYLHDKLAEVYYGEIEKVVHFSRRINLNYDCLRAIAFELNLGLDFETAIKDLNILHMSGERYNLALKLSNGESLKLRNVYLDTFDDNEATFRFEDPETGYDICYAEFIPSENKWNTEVGSPIIRGEDIKLEWYDYITEAEKRYEKHKDDEDYEPDKDDLKLCQKYKGVTPLYLELRRVPNKSLHYAVQ